MKKLFIIALAVLAFSCKKNDPEPTPDPAPAQQQPPPPSVYTATITYLDSGNTYSYSREMKEGASPYHTFSNQGAAFYPNPSEVAYRVSLTVCAPGDSSKMINVPLNQNFVAGSIISYSIGAISFTNYRKSGTDNIQPETTLNNYFNKFTSVTYLGNRRYSQTSSAIICDFELTGAFNVRVKNDVTQAIRDVSGTYRLRFGCYTK